MSRDAGRAGNKLGVNDFNRKPVWCKKMRQIAWTAADSYPMGACIICQNGVKTTVWEKAGEWTSSRKWKPQETQTLRSVSHRWEMEPGITFYKDTADGNKSDEDGLDTSWRRQALPIETLPHRRRQNRPICVWKYTRLRRWSLINGNLQAVRPVHSRKPSGISDWPDRQEWTSDMEKTITWAIWMRMEEAFIFLWQ